MSPGGLGDRPFLTDFSRAGARGNARKSAGRWLTAKKEAHAEAPFPPKTPQRP